VKARAAVLSVVAVLALSLSATAHADDSAALTSPAQLPQRTARFDWDKALL